jgi:hypothetical protein
MKMQDSSCKYARRILQPNVLCKFLQQLIDLRLWKAALQLNPGKEAQGFSCNLTRGTECREASEWKLPS